MKTLYSFILTVGALCFLLGSTSHAKDPFTTIDNLRGTKVIKSYIKGNLIKPAAKNDALNTTDALSKYTTSTSGEFIYLGGNQMRLVTSEWSTDVDILGMASGHFVWTDNNGLRYEITEMPEDSSYANGPIYNGDTMVGKFTIAPKKLKLDKASGRWTGVLAFPGGTFLDIALQISGIAENSYGECSHGSLETRVEYPGFPYQEASTLHCDESFGNFGEHDYSLGTFFWDDSQGGIWFVSLSGSLSPWDTFQGSVYLIPVLNAGNFAEGVFLLERPQPFNP